MTQPITVDIPFNDNREAVRTRLDKGVGKLAAMFPGGAAVDHRWEGDSMHFTVQAMGQRVSSKLDLMDDHVHAVIDLPPFLALFADKIRAKLAKDGPALLK